MVYVILWQLCIVETGTRIYASLSIIRYRYRDIFTCLDRDIDLDYADNV